MSSHYIQTMGAVALVDDQESFLDVVKMGLPADRFIYTFANPYDAVEPLIRANEAIVNEEVLLAKILSIEEPAVALCEALRWIRDGDRHRNIETAFIDYNMPGMDGLALLNKIVQPRIMRVLLTGQGSTDEAVQAFNQGLIDIYVPKTKEGLGRELRDIAERGAGRHRYLMWSRLNQDVDRIIKQSAGWRAIQEIMRKYLVTEFLLLPSPCGYVCRTKHGGIGWLQIDTDDSMQGCLEVVQGQGWSDEDLDKVRCKKWTAPIELADVQHLCDVAPATFVEVHVLSEAPWIGAAFFKV